MAGGGVALVDAVPALDNVQVSEGDERTGLNILRRALEEPLRQIAINAGRDGAVIANEVRSSQAGHGFDALNGQFVDMFQAGIVDPAKVTRSALQNAVSVGGMFLTTDALISEQPEEPSAAAAGMGGMGGMGGMM